MPPWHVKSVEPVGHLRLAVCVFDGTVGYARLEPSALSGAFEPLSDPAFFDRFFVEAGAVTWPGEIDLAPDAMHDEIIASGEYVFA